DVVARPCRRLLVTLGDRGSAYVASPAGTPDPLRRYQRGIARPSTVRAGGAVRSGRLGIVSAPDEGDSTGCGAVWGATCVLNLFAGADIEDAMRSANRAAARNVEHRGATGLHHHLSGRIGT